MEQLSIAVEFGFGFWLFSIVAWTVEGRAGPLQLENRTEPWCKVQAGLKSFGPLHGKSRKSSENGFPRTEFRFSP